MIYERELEKMGEHTLNRKDILIRIIGTGINITPNALNFLSASSLSNEDIEKLIRQVGFLPDFQSHITMDVLNQTNYGPGPASNVQEQKTSPPKPSAKTKKKNVRPKKSKKKAKKTAQKRAVVNSEKDTMSMLRSNSEIDMNTDAQSASSVSVMVTKSKQSMDATPVDSQAEPKLDATRKIDEKTSGDTSNSSRTAERLAHINKIKESSVVLDNIGGLTPFNPIAKDHYEEIEILKDSSKNLFTTGSIEDFYALMNDRFDRIKNILYRSNSDIAELMEINQINRQQDSGDVSFIGMVQEKSQVGQLNHFKIRFEDPTGEINGLVLNKDRNQELYQQMIYLLEDHIVYVNGYLKIDRKKRSRIIYVNELRWPDVPYSSIPKVDECPVSFALLSDLHMGSIDYEPKLMDRFIRFLKGEIGNERQRELAGSIKYILIDGDLVDGIGNYPDQDKELLITDIYKQFEFAADVLSEIPDYVKIIYVPGNHEPVRNALPQPAVDPKYCQDLLDMGTLSLGNPSMVKLHGLKFLMFHGDSIFDMNISVPGLKNEQPELAMREYLRCRHLCPIYGKKTGVAPTATDWLVIDEVPHVFQTGHVHINGSAFHNGVLMVNAGTFQKQTGYMKSLGVDPTPGIPIIVNVRDRKVNAQEFNLNI